MALRAQLSAPRIQVGAVTHPRRVQLRMAGSCLCYPWASELRPAAELGVNEVPLVRNTQNPPMGERVRESQQGRLLSSASESAL